MSAGTKCGAVIARGPMRSSLVNTPKNRRLFESDARNWESVAELSSSGSCQIGKFIGKIFSSVEFRAETPVSAKICTFVAVQSGVDTGAGSCLPWNFFSELDCIQS